MTMEASQSVPKSDPSVPIATRRIPRMWPALVLVAVYWAVLGIAKLLDPDVITPLQHFLTIFYAPLVLSLGIVVWWLFFSRQAWVDRLVGLALLAGVGIAVIFIAHKSIMFG